MWQPETSEPINPDELAVPLACAFAMHVAKACSDFARVVECRRQPENGVEIVTFEIDIGVPQRPVYAINATEVVSVCFVPGNSAPPLIAVGRPDFPDTPHQNLVPEGFPSVLCVDDRPWQDIRGGYTASELMARIQVWFTKACEGELHGDDQPFDPFFLYDGTHEIIVSQDAAKAMNAKGKLSIWAAAQPPRFLIVTSAREGTGANGQLHLHVLHVDVAPEAMRRMRKAPRTLGQLAGLLAERNADLIAPLKQSILEWLATGKTDEDVTWLTCILVRLPQIHPHTGEIGAARPMAFLCADSPGRIGEALGVLSRNGSDAAQAVRYLPMISPEITADGLDGFPIQIAPVHLETDGAGASDLAGRRTDLRELVMIGAGSLGSHLAEYLSREGLFRWTVVDDDVLLPHNVARHTLARVHFGQGKARNIASRLDLIRCDTAPRAIEENVLDVKPSDTLVQALQRADIIIDASASVPVSRWLSDRPDQARRMCAFFTPDGRSAVLMAEAADRSVTLRDLESAYLREILANPTLKDHLRPGQQLRYTGACRALTNQIPASSIAVLSGLLAAGVAEASGDDAAALRFWTMREDGSIDCANAPTSAIKISTSGWTVTLPAALRDDLVARREGALPSETGGPLVGVIDYEAKHLAAIHALATPPDSAGTRAHFIRGTRGLQRLIEEAQSRSGGQVRYIGEWHSHPPGASASPSSTDINQIYQLSLVLDLDGLPALSLIVGEQGMAMLVGKVV
ncbi:ThiF family adenylyltransferase [Pseudaminobacter sp. 19-2017]|uniref:ThiF family adenylyltransferase n=1 Tax=Pseudaminobacter soli (ex Zhang et al. 2022) TaxID=2831468 RepID=A0A942E859_9HYPH|nr:ThiF family adenylyltransferase [Pseudaminobacter soli]MBS3652200.1 ThiF family adenylyltransferase [Pseudaminobacter soli]